jgi:hypothetical protein
VELHDAGPAAEPAPLKELTTGQAARRDGPGAVRPVPLTPAAFLTAQDLAKRSREATLKRHKEWLAASDALRRDPSLLVYYPFQSDQPWTRTLLDQSGGRERPHDGAIVGAAWAAGRWPGKQGLEFRRVSDRVRIHVPGEFESVTLAAWVRVDGLPNLNNALLLADGWDDGGLHWLIGEAGKLVLGVQGPRKKSNANYHAFGVFTPERFGQWAHLAVVFDRANGRVTHYVDGQPAARVPAHPDTPPLRIGDAEIGNWNIATHRNNNPIRHFSGCIDEVMAFSRALDDAEIEQLYTQGRPSP